MHRIDTDGHVANLFDEGDPGVPRQPTQVDSEILNAFQEELCNAVTSNGTALAKNTNTQLRDAVAGTVAALTVHASLTGADVKVSKQGRRAVLSGTALNGSGGAFAAGTALFTLAVGYRPHQGAGYTTVLPAAILSGGGVYTPCAILINGTTGVATCTAAIPNTEAIYFEGLTFYHTAP